MATIDPKFLDYIYPDISISVVLRIFTSMVDHNTTFVIQPVIDNSWSIEQVAEQCPPSGWKEVFVDALPELRTTSKGIENEKAMGYTIYPAMTDMFQAFRLTPLDNVKVVIVGQDPYFNASYNNGKSYPTATGISFSVRNWDNVPSSLQNIYKELSQSVQGFINPDHGDLSEWALQGVLMMNISLTVRAGLANSHDPIVWDGFISKVLKAIDAVNPNCIYVMWGRNAQALASKLPSQAIKLIAPHPSGRSAHTGFFGCNHFNIINEHLYKIGKSPINWNLTHIRDQWSRIYSINDIDVNAVPLTVDNSGNIITNDINSSNVISGVDSHDIAGEVGGQ